METRLAEHLQDGGIGARLHGVAHGEAEGVGESQHLVGLLLEARQIVDVRGSAELLAHFHHLLGGQELELLDVAAASSRVRLSRFRSLSLSLSSRALSSSFRYYHLIFIIVRGHFSSRGASGAATCGDNFFYVFLDANSDFVMMGFRCRNEGVLRGVSARVVSASARVLLHTRE